jgi:hypothetical protein
MQQFFHSNSIVHAAVSLQLFHRYMALVASLLKQFPRSTSLFHATVPSFMQHFLHSGSLVQAVVPLQQFFRYMALVASLLQQFLHITSLAHAAVPSFMQQFLRSSSLVYAANINCNRSHDYLSRNVSDCVMQFLKN